MRAVVMAGGEGTRLRPLTVNRPKPMVPVANRPVMEHIVRLVKQHGITEIVATLQYLPDVIQDYFGDGSDFGVAMNYSVETKPLGTAGSVKLAEHLLDETFIVISGDALTDMDLTDLIRFHKEKGSVATLALTRVDKPLEFGVVITDGSGRITRFLEKPSWSEVFSDTINTGIYILEPEVLQLMEENQVYDWSKDIFPLLLETGRPLYGYVSRDYWCDIGSLEQYLQANHDVLARQVRADIPGEEIRRGVWLGRNVQIDPTAELEGPCAIGDGVVIRPGARVAEYSVLGPNTVLDAGAEVKRSVSQHQAYIGRGADVRAAIIGKGAAIGQRASVGQGAVIGDQTNIGEGAIVKPWVKIWPNKTVEAGAQVNTTLVWGSRQQRVTFGPDGVNGLGNIEITPELAVRLGEAFGSTMAKGEATCVSRDSSPAAVMLKRAIMAGLASAGARVYNLESAPLPLTRYAVGALGAKGGIYVGANPHSPGQVTIKLLDSRGVDIETAAERKIETMMVREDTRKVPVEEIGRVSYPAKVMEFYRTGFLEKIDETAIRKRQFKVVFDYGHGAAAGLMSAVIGDLGCQELALNAGVDWRRLSRTEAEVEAALRDLVATIGAIKADFGVLFDATGQRIRLVDNRGRILSGQHALALFAHLALEGQKKQAVTVPVTATAAIEKIARGNWVSRTKTGARALMQAAAASKCRFAGDESGGFIFPEFYAGLDGIFATARLMQMLALSGLPLDEVVDDLPRIAVATEQLECPLEAKGKVMRLLSDATAALQPILVDGIKVEEEGRWIALIPDPVRPLLHITYEPAEEAGALVEHYRQVVAQATQETALEQHALDPVAMDD
ncbi:MAG TPA: sugar phosphate nucleotidyltransferase [Symbiobacteriaceae bacterium]|nr:sugar phosphate nucleotidyltransferase [Symbiobacteriaceae bacterium]